MSMSKQQITETVGNGAPLKVDNSTPLKRRGWLLGLGAAGAAAVVAKALPVAAVEEQAVTVAETVVPEADGGYRLSPHVLRYYETARA